MTPTTQLNTALEFIERLSDDEQETLLEIIRHRLAERARQRIVRDVQDGRRGFESGQLKPMSVDEIMDEIDS
jgi:hypothetical protein